MTSLAHTSFSSSPSRTSRTPFAPLSRIHSRTPSAARAVPMSSSNGVMSTPRSSSSLLLQPYVHASAGSNSTASASPGASFGSSDSEGEDEQDDVPPTPDNNDRFALFARQAGIKVASPTPVRAALKGVELSRFFEGKDSEVKVGGGEVNEVFKPSHPADQLLSPNAKSFFPSFGDFLPSIKQEEEERRRDLAAFSWTPSEDDKENDLDSLAQRTAAFSLNHQHERKKSFDPCRQFARSPGLNGDSFTFFPSPGFRSPDDRSSASTKPTSTSSSLLSPKPEEVPTFRSAPEAPQVHHHHHQHSLSLPSPYHQPQPRQPISLPGFPATPPRTPVRSSLARSETPSSLPYLQQPVRVAHQVPPAGYFAVPVSLPPTPTSARASIPAAAAVGYYAVPVAPSPLAASLVALPTPPTVLSSTRSGDDEATPYPLSPADTDRIAKLHNGRVPTLQQLAPPEAMAGGGTQPPIVNTGNQGQMVVQAGDWRCGVCAFVNWRRRKICLRCFPYANDIGNILTIQSQRAAYLAQPSPSRSTFPSSASLPSTGGSATFHIQHALPAYTASSLSGSSDGGVPSAHLAAVAMARSSTFPPSSAARSSLTSNEYSSLALLQQYSYPRYPAAVAAAPQTPQRQSVTTTPSPRYPPANVAPQQPHHFHQQSQASSSPLPAVIWSSNQQDDLSSPTGSSAGALSATSAGEHAAWLRARQAAAAAAVKAGSKEEVKMFPSLAVGEGKRGEVDGGWERAARNGYVAPGPSMAAVGMGMAEL